MDDVDAVQAQIARNMLASDDWVTARLDGVPYLEKAPLIYWAIAISYKIFGVHDWVARIPIALSAIALCWLTAAFGAWAFGKRAGFYAGLCLATCIGLFLFTRILIPDVMLTFAVTLALWSFLRALDEEEPRPRLWAFLLAVGLGVGLLLKSLIGVVFPIAAGAIYLYFTGGLFSPRTWKRLHVLSGSIVVILIAAPWHILATLRNPPYFAATLHSGPGEYHGFLWFYFINEQFLRFLNLRYPRDYNTVPRLHFWLLNLVWLFPWSVFLPAVGKLSFKPADRAGRARLLSLCWIGFLLVFFTFSTTQEYYSMPCYPAFALLLGSAMAAGGDWVRRGTRALFRHRRMRRTRSGLDFPFRPKSSRPRRYFRRAYGTSGSLHALARTHAGLDSPFVRLSAAAARCRRLRLTSRRPGNDSLPRPARVHRRRSDDGAVFSRRATRARCL